MRPIIINGTVLCDPITGIPRYVYEVVTRLDALLAGTGLDVRLVYRDDGRPLQLPADQPLKNIRLVPLKAVRYCFNLLVLPRYLRQNGAYYCGFASDVTITRPSAVVLHDIRPLVMAGDKAAFRFKFLVHCKTIARYAGEIYTDSENQRQLIIEKLGIPADKLGVVYAGWEHIGEVEADEGIFAKNPQLKRGGYYYALGSMAPHKNYRWVREVAARNPDKTFVVAGGKNLRSFGDDAEAVNTDNILYPGYVTDGENKSLMQHCKAFLHPALFEGFGIPPLEALALGAPVMVSNASCLPELYGGCVRYFDPNDYTVDLDALLAQPVAPPDALLKKYSWDATARFWLAQFKRYALTP